MEEGGGGTWRRSGEDRGRPRTASLVFHHSAVHCTRATRVGTSMSLNSAGSSRRFFATSATSPHVADRANACCQLYKWLPSQFLLIGSSRWLFATSAMPSHVADRANACCQPYRWKSHLPGHCDSIESGRFLDIAVRDKCDVVSCG